MLSVPFCAPVCVSSLPHFGDFVTGLLVDAVEESSVMHHDLFNIL